MKQALIKWLVVGIVLTAITICTLALAGLPVLESAKLVFGGAFGDTIGWSRTAIKATPLLLTALGVLIAWRAGMYNIGGEGQFIVGGLFGAAFAKLMAGSTGPPMIETAVILLGSVIGGAAWASIAAWLYVRRGVQVVISTILLNFVAIQLLSWAVEHPLQEAKHQLPQSDVLPATVMLWRPDRQLDFHAGVLLALVVAPIVFVILFRTVFGFRVRLVGANDRAARAARINTSRIQLQALSVSGALCGLAGGVEFAGLSGVLGTDFAQGWGFMAIPVALIGGLHPIGVILSAIFFGGVFAGTENLARFTTSGPTLLYVIQAVSVLALVGLSSWKTRTRLAAEVS